MKQREYFRYILDKINFPPIMINNKTFIRNIIRNKNYD